ncbi:hypothetical protein REPUB_Repub12eG0055200 [Reevesia pubescens]
MTVLFWNVRGAGNSTFFSHARDMITLHRPNLVIFVEPKISGLKAEHVIKRFGFDDSTRVDARGFAGGIWVLWNNVLGKVRVLHKTDQFITLLIDKNWGLSWAVTAVYASPIPVVREMFWQFMKEFDHLDHTPWLLVGDFNQILTHDEKQGGGRESVRRMTQFLEVMQCRNWIDLGANGCQFTWTNNHPLPRLIKKRLDRALCNVDWR